MVACWTLVLVDGLMDLGIGESCSLLVYCGGYIDVEVGSSKQGP